MKKFMIYMGVILLLVCGFVLYGIASGNDPGPCIADCASEQGICIGQCQGNGQCISQCAAAHGRCVSRCFR